MNSSARIIAGVGVVAVCVLGAWLMLPAGTSSLQAEGIDATQEFGSGVLDGMTFASELGPLGKPADVKDVLVFENGMFVSIECERQCNYPASAYLSRSKGDVTEFISETRCPHKDATIVWRGEVTDGRIKGVATWTTNRWYWTLERDIAFEGTLSSPVASVN